MRFFASGSMALYAGVLTKAHFLFAQNLNDLGVVDDNFYGAVGNSSDRL
jgi:hypothetical protein